MSPLYIIDAYGLIYRYYFVFIKKPLRNSAGQNVSALFGFARAVINLLETKKCAYIAAAFDSHAPTFRHELYGDYKATRQKAPPDLHEQVPFVKEFLSALGIPLLAKEGFEADDIIATLAGRCKEEGREAYIISHDKDLLQLVGAGVFGMQSSKETGGGYDILDEEAVKALWGLPPERLLDMLSLMGDASDNVPGVRGVGEKTALKLLQRYGTLDGIYENIAGIEGSAAKKLAEGRESAYLSRDLVKLRFDVPLPVSSMEELRLDAPKFNAANEVLQKYEIREIRFKTDNAKAVVTAQKDALQKEEQLLIAPDAPSISIEDLLNDAKKSGVLEIAQSEILREADSNTLQAIKDFAANPAHTIVSTDIKEVYKVTGGSPRWQCKYIDTGIINWLKGKEGKMRLEKLEKYDEIPEIYEKIEAPLIPILAEMELKGVFLEKEALFSYKTELASEISSVERTIYSMAGHEFNVNSPKQLQQVLFEERALSPTKKNKSGYSTAQDVLEELAKTDPLASLVLRYRHLAKLQSTYVDTLPNLVDERGRIHTTFDQTGTATGRLSSRQPNLQNIPVREEEGRRIRYAFAAEKGSLLISADYSQIELVVLAHLSRDAALCEAFNDGGDIHRRTAALIFGAREDDVSAEQRRIAKVINFGVIYGMSAFRLSNELAIPRRDAAAFIDTYFNTYSGVHNFIAKTILDAEKNGFVETLFGRRRDTPEINSPNKTVKSAAERAAVNTPIQGTAADIVKMAMIKVDAALAGKGARQLLQVHDELILECPESEAPKAAAIVQEAMESVCALAVPLRVSIEIGRRWGEFH